MNEQAQGSSTVARPPPLPLREVSVASPAGFPSGGSLTYHTPEQWETYRSWVLIARFASTGQWHAARAALARGKIDSLMGEGEDAMDEQSRGIDLLVPEGQVARARLILQALRDGTEWCPRCGTSSIDTLPFPWWWTLWSILFLGVAPFAPPRFRCRTCGHRWE